MPVQTKAKLIKLYGEEITFYNNANQGTVKVFQQKAEELLDQFYRQPKLRKSPMKMRN